MPHLSYICRKIIETIMQDQDRDYTIESTDLKEFVGSAIRPSGGTILFCEEGNAIVSVNFKRRPLQRGNIVLVFPDTLFIVHAVSKKFRALNLEMSPELFDETTFSLSSAFFDRVYDDPIFPTSAEQQAMLHSWHRHNDYCMHMLIRKVARMTMRNQIQNLFVVIEALTMLEVPAKNIKPISTVRQQFNRFCRLLVEYCYSQHDVKFYANKLCITPYYLSKITFRILGMSPKEIIDRQIVMEMKRMLISTDLSAKEIADCFHFDGTSYMGRYFRRHTGMTPTEFRAQ